MITASQKKKENIAEYLLYMWQIEDLIRANNLDIDKIRHNIIDQYQGLDEPTRQELCQWYESLIDMMHNEGVERIGHLQLNKNTLNDMADLHHRILASNEFPAYSAEFYKTLPYIVELRAKGGNNPAGEIESCFNALYGLLLLRLQKKKISEETLQASKQISRFLAMLADYYNRDRCNDLFKAGSIN